MPAQLREVKLNLSHEVLEYLENEAVRRQMPLDKLVSEVLEDYFDDPGDEEILQSLGRGIKQALAGHVRPAHEVLDEIERESGVNANES